MQAGQAIQLVHKKDFFGIPKMQEKARQLATYCLLLALLSCFHSSGKNKSEQRLSKLQNTAESESAESES